MSSRLSFTKSAASALLDTTRAIAALLVCLEHWRNLLFVSYPQLPLAHRILYALPYAVTDAGHAAVIIFFVLSGYLISGGVFRMMDQDTWTWRRYLTHRLVRLWIVLIPALLLGALFDASGIHLHRAPRLYSGLIPNGLWTDVVHCLNLRSFFSSLFFLQGILGHSFGSNGPLWSLANEFWYYILFPLGLIALRGPSSFRQRLGCGALFLVVAWFVGRQIIELFPVWLLGTLIAGMRVPRIRIAMQMPVFLLYPPLFFFLAKVHPINGLVSDYLTGAATFLLLLCLLQATGPAPKENWVALSRTGARFSYTLYLVHLPLLMFLASFTVGDVRWTPTLQHDTMAVLELMLVIAWAYVIAWMTEFRTGSVRRWIEDRFLPASRISGTASAQPPVTNSESIPG